MLTLALLRHAKSGWDDPTLDDHERPLARRGTRDVPRIGAFMAANDLVPDLVLCSDAVRTRATLTLLLPAWAPRVPEIRYDKKLYLASPLGIREHLVRLGTGPALVMVIGHNPGLHVLALELAGRGNGKDLAALAEKYPTCALAVIDCETTNWGDLRPGRGTLRLLATPKRLPSS